MRRGALRNSPPDLGGVARRRRGGYQQGGNGGRLQAGDLYQMRAPRRALGSGGFGQQVGGGKAGAGEGLLAILRRGPTDGEFISLPPALFFLYYFLRPWRLLGAVASWLVQAGVARLRRLWTSKRSNVISRG